ncbi:hypothetical protein V3H18_05965 [Methylocystis sp. 9N]|uniref:Uncharacterized protein n=1 Tax=Methylocystis borbori TaxID=3118750 RepID=A0ABU7XFC2_9HYPH
MHLKKLNAAATPNKLGDYLTKAASKSPMHAAHGAGGAVSVRKDDYNGHAIEIRTTYQILVDGKKIRAPLSVDAAGQVHCHSLPNYQTASAVDLVKALIDGFPDEFERKPAPRKRAGAAKKVSKHKH